MKRISLCAMLLVWVPGIAQAYYYGCGVHYSPYAFNYDTTGLVPGGVEYTPYALSYYNSGLVADYGVCQDYYWDYAFPIFGVRGRHASHGVAQVPNPVRRAVPAPARPTHPPARPPVHHGPGPRPPGHCSTGDEGPHRDGLDIIREHLRSRGFASVSINRILRVDNQLVSVDVLVKDRNLLLKYWNPEEVQRLSTKEASQQRVYAKYKQDWERFAQGYQQTGGEIYTVNASEPQTIVAALESCPKLSPANGDQTIVLYAKE